MPTAVADQRFFLEVLRVLVHVAFADGHVSAEESFGILETARARGLPAEEVSALEAALAGKAPLPALDLQYLAEHRSRVLEVARLFAEGDGLVGAEVRALERLNRLLSP